MKISTVLPFILYASLAAAAVKKPKFGGSSGSEEEEDEEQQAAGISPTASSTLNVGQVISSFYPTKNLPTLAPSISTSLASGLLAVESSWFASPEYTSVDAAISRVLPASLSASVSASGYLYGEIMTESWFTKSVPAALQTAVVKYVSAVESVHIKYVETSAAFTPARTGAATLPATASASVQTRIAGSGAIMTAAPLHVMGIVGVIGGVVAVVL